MPRTMLLIALLSLAACGEFPDAGQTTSGRSDFPTLLPLADLLGDVPVTEAIVQEENDALAARAAALQARAERIRQAPI